MKEFVPVLKGTKLFSGVGEFDITKSLHDLIEKMDIQNN